MKKLNIAISLIILVVCFSVDAQSGNAKELAEQGLIKYPFIDGIITYEISGEASGSSTLSFKYFGWLSASNRDMTYTLYGISSEDHRLEYINGDFIYSIDMKTKKGKTSKDFELSKLTQYKSPIESREAVYSSKGGIKTGTDTILDKPVNIWKFSSGNMIELWEWDGIPLKMTRKLGKLTFTLTATDIVAEQGVELTFPEGVTFN
ncbi:MAG: hypothetical protein JXQ90_00935 [Cyclobacteriaceae bacterium]